MQLEDKLLGLFGAGGAVTLLVQYLQTNSDPRYTAVAGLLVAVGVILKAFVSEPAPTTPAVAPK